MDANERLHHEWLGMAQPEGLVVTVAALKAAEANITWPVTELQATVRDLSGGGKAVADVRGFLRDVLEWSDEQVVAGADVPAALRVRLDGEEVLAPALALRSGEDDGKFVFLVEETHRKDLDAASDDRRWSATPHQRFERLLRETGVFVGLLTNGRDFRLVYAPKGESAGWVTFRLGEMMTVDGRPLLGALHMLLNERRLLWLEESRRLGALLKASREYQNTVSTKLREQILAALRELLTGLQSADRRAGERILGGYRRGHLHEVYTGLVTVLMRMVFVLYAEERGLLPMESELYASSYSLSRLHSQLQEDYSRHGDTIDDRYGAWGRVITLFRLLHDGARAADGLFLPARKGAFFDPDAFPFLEGRPRGDTRQAGQVLELPKVSDGVVLRVLERLLRLDGERLQYKGLDVEQIGSVYEGLMGFEIQTAAGESLCLTPDHVVVDLRALAKLPGAERLKELKAQAGLDLKDKAAAEVKDAKDAAGLHAALSKRISSRQPGLIAEGTLFLQPGEERRRTGSHYTPRSLTQPIVETTLRPVLERLGPEVRPEQILDLKICDPAMGSGAFLVEACRQLADHLVAAWRRTGAALDLPRDEDPVLHARRLIAQRCLYGVDKNPLAVDLSRLSIWLVTFAREHPFTFVDHALRHGDSLVGLSREQIYNLSFEPAKSHKVSEQARNQLYKAVRRAEELRAEIHAIGDPPDNQKLDELWDEANHALSVVRTIGDAMVASYFAGDSDKARKKGLEELAPKLLAWLQTGAYGAEIDGMVTELREGEKPVPAFHWEVEFPEVFSRENGGFDCFVGNPPFLAGGNISPQIGFSYHEWLVESAPGSTGNADLAAFFFRTAHHNCRHLGTIGLLSTNTISQGDTRAASLRAIRKAGGTIYEATRRVSWPGTAGVVVSIVHVVRGSVRSSPVLDGRPVKNISAFLMAGSGDEEPVALTSNKGLSCLGGKVWGAGFTFEEDAADTPDGPSPLTRARELLQDKKNADIIRPYMGGEEFNNDPRQQPSRMVIDFGFMSEEEARTYPTAFDIVERKVKPARQKVLQRDRRELWWLHGSRSPELRQYFETHTRCLAVSGISRHVCFAFIQRGTVLANTLVLIMTDGWDAYANLSSRVHEIWARFLASTMKDDLRYTPSDCLDTFPFAQASRADRNLELSGKAYDDFRAALMIRNNEGLTKTYNRFHNPDETSPDIHRLRELHAAMDRAVLDAYGWADIRPEYDFRPQLDESIRYTWGEDTRDEVLARLLELNRVMAAKEAEEAAKSEAAKPAKKPRAAKRAKQDQTTLALPLDEPPPSPPGPKTR